MLALAWAAPCAAQELALPLDVFQGQVIGAPGPRTPYVFGIGLEPAADWGPFRLGGLVTPSYRNPRWDLGLGGRVSYFVPIAARGVGMRLGAEGQYLPCAASARVGLGVIGEAFGLLRVGLWPAYDTRARKLELMVSLGVDLASWGRLLGNDRKRGS